MGAMGGVALAPVAMGGLVLGYYACGQVVSGKYGMSPHFTDPAANDFFNPWAGKAMDLLFKVLPFLVILFLAIGTLPQLMAKLAERRRKKHFNPDKSKSV